MKKTLLITLFSCLLATLAYLGYGSYRKVQTKHVFAEQIKHLPNATIFQWAFQKPVLNQQATVVLFFHPDCEHCQYEAKTISEQQTAFSSVNLWWVSIADSSAIKAFSKKYQLENLPNIYWASLSAEKVTQTFGSISVPHIFIYDTHQTLQKEFKGETKIEAILKYL